MTITIGNTNDNSFLFANQNENATNQQNKISVFLKEYKLQQKKVEYKSLEEMEKFLTQEEIAEAKENARKRYEQYHSNFAKMFYSPIIRDMTIDDLYYSEIYKKYNKTDIGILGKKPV